MVAVGCFSPDGSMSPVTDTEGSEGSNSASTQVTTSSDQSEGGEVECNVGEVATCWEAPDRVAVPQPTVAPLGNCRYGIKTCLPDGRWSVCEGAILPLDADSCEPVGADDNCNGVPNEGCPCTDGISRACGTDVGNCSLGTQSCQGEVWGPCEGGTMPLPQDSCEVVGDDANCDGIANTDCPCVGDETEACGECSVRTCDPVSREWGECIEQSEFCTIDGECFGENAPNPSNSCQYCDPSRNPEGWTNVEAGTSCDDGIFCNGEDTCDARGACEHAFPEGDRCRGTDVCDRTECDEEERSCVLPAHEICSQRTEYRCSSGEGCGAEVESRELRQYCSGSSSTCDGAVVPVGDWQVTEQCESREVCTQSVESVSCNESIDCVAWCDRVTGLCWSQEVRQMNFASAEAYCGGATWAGATWRLPTVTEWIGVLRGCNNGSEGDEFLVSSCRVLGDSTVTCAACEDNQGPDTEDGGCYWVPNLQGPCMDGMGYWSQTSSHGGYWIAHVRSGYLSAYGVPQFMVNTRCVTEL